MLLLRYFNPVGAHPSGLMGEDPCGVPNNLMPFIAQVAVGRRPQLNIFGSDYPTPDGTGVRDYIHVLDLADGHVAALRHALAHPGLHTYNLGTGQGHSVLEVMRAFERASGRPVAHHLGPRRPGDIAACWANPAKAQQELGWQAQLGLAQMCAHTWHWQSTHLTVLNPHEPARFRPYRAFPPPLQPFERALGAGLAAPGQAPLARPARSQR